MVRAVGTSWSIIVGFLVGLAARPVLGGEQPLDFSLTTTLGMAGSLLAEYVGGASGCYLSAPNITNGALPVLCSIGGAALVLGVCKLLLRRGR